MNNTNFQEDYSSQIPALRTLINAGYTFLSQKEAMEQRFGRTGNVLLEPILKEQLAEINEIRVSSSQTEKFTQSNIDEAVLKLKEVPLEEGYTQATEHIYELLTLGTTLDQSIDGNRREYTLQFIDWKNWENNVFHVAEEYSVSTTDGKKELRPDIVLFVNGIPFAIIENKREDLKDPIGDAISQHFRNQQEDRIRKLYVYAQVLMSCAVGHAKYATNGTPANFWSTWREKEISEKEMAKVKNKALPKKTVQAIIAPRTASSYFSPAQADQIHNRLTNTFELTEQDKLLYAVGKPERLLDMVQNFILYDNGIKKVARYQQYFAVKKAMVNLRKYQQGRRQGGVIWHTQGSGKSLTMGFMSEAIARDDSIKNPKIVLVTDRTDLDKQITGTFQNIGMEVNNAKTGRHLVEILQSNSDAVVTTIINKFETAVKQLKEPLESANIFVLIDEGHRTQYGTFNVNMEKALPNACFMAFTGTPLFKKDKNTVSKFGGMIDTYTVREAVEDQAVLPLVYEGRMADQTVNREAIDNYFDRVSEDLSEQEQADLKKKFSQKSHIADADQTIYATAWDIADHYRKNFQKKTELKGQVVCSSKNTAVKYYNYLKEMGKVSCALIISPPDDREGEESAYTTTSDAVKKYWAEMMDQYGNSKRYEESIINQFKHDSQPELIIVVDKLLTGFDAPRNTVLYLTRKLKGHTLLQAIARVNRLHEDKDYGYIVDYAGVVSELDDALLTYSDMSEFDDEDLEGTMTHITEEIKKLDPAHQVLLDMFKDIDNKDDLEAYQQKLRPDDVRDDFYKRLTNYARILKLALSSLDFHKQTSEKKIKTYKDDLKFFMNLRTAVAQRYSDKIDYKEYEGQIQKLMDQHISTKDIKPLTELVNIFDEEAFEKEVEKTIGEAAKADKIASRTAKHITEKMDDDPAFYKKFSQLIQQSIDDFYSQRISELEYLERMQEYRDKVLTKTDSSIPKKIRDNATVSAYYGTMNSAFKDKRGDVETHRDLLTDAALKIEEIINNRKKVNWQNNTDVTKKMELEIGDYIYDEIRKPMDLDLNFTELDKIADQMVSIAKRKA